jgi:hypothetical protein
MPFPFLVTVVTVGKRCPVPFLFSLGLSYYPPTTNTMSQTPPEVASHSDYQAIFDSALQGYQKKTGKDLTSDSLLCRFETCDSPDAILALLRAQILLPGQTQSGGDKLLTWLNPTINVLNAFSETIGEVVGLVGLGRLSRDLRTDTLFEAYPPARVIFTGIGLLLSVSFSSDSLSRVIVTPRRLRPLRLLVLVEISSLASSSA